MSSPQEGRGSNGASPTQTITTIDTTWASPQINSTGHGVEVLVDSAPGVLGVGTDGSSLRLATSAGEFRFVGNAIEFPHGQQLDGIQLGDSCTELVTLDHVSGGIPAEGTLLYYHNSEWHALPAGLSGQALVISSGDPIWGNVAQTTIGSDLTEVATNDTLAGTSAIINNLNRIRYQLAQLGTGAWNTLRAMVQLSPPVQQTGTINVSGEIAGSDFKPGGLVGATASSRYVGATTTGHPLSGTFALGDYVVSQNGTIWICTSAGTPGTWTQVSSGGTVTSVGLSMPADFSVTGSPVTTAGTLSVTATTQNAHLVKAGPASGPAAVPTYRALVSADVPSPLTIAGEITASDFAPSGLVGATAPSRYVGGTGGGSPVSGTFVLGDFVVAETGGIWVCTAGGNPGTWAQVGAGGGSGGFTSPLTTKGDLLGYDTANDRLPVGANNTFLVADSGQVLGLQYRALVQSDVPQPIPAAALLYANASNT